MDHGDELVNDEMPGLRNQCGINIKRTAAYSPWANGLNERNHATGKVDSLQSSSSAALCILN